jgi:hypothetical protein
LKELLKGLGGLFPKILAIILRSQSQWERLN